MEPGSPVLGFGARNEVDSLVRGSTIAFGEEGSFNRR